MGRWSGRGLGIGDGGGDEETKKREEEMHVDFDARGWLRVTYSRLRHGRTDGCASGGVRTNAIGGGGAETGEGVEGDGRTRRRSGGR